MNREISGNAIAPNMTPQKNESPFQIVEQIGPMIFAPQKNLARRISSVPPTPCIRNIIQRQ